MANLAIYDKVLSPSQVYAHWQAGAGTLTETTDDRINRICTWVGVGFANSGGRVQGAQATGGRKPLEVLQEIARGETRILYDYGGGITGRWQDQHPTTVTLTLDAAADLQGSPVFSRSDQGRTAQVTATSLSAGSFTALDAGATANTSRSIDTALNDPADLAGCAQNGVAGARDARLRLRHLTLDLVTATSVAAADVFATILGDRVRTTSLPSDLLGWTYQDGYLLGYTERINIGSYTIDMDLEPADAPPSGVFDDASLGTFMAGGTMTLTSGITSSVLPSICM